MIQAVNGHSITHQGQFIKQIYSIFPNENIHVDSRKKSNYKYPSESLLELDVWIPNLNLAFEFQDPYHYVTVWYSQKNVLDVKASDNIHIKLLVNQSGVTLLDVPCWWDGDKESLLESIKFHRPDLDLEETEDDPIPLNPPQDFFTRAELPGVGELMLATFPPNPDQFSNSTSSVPWWMGEKYDGVRCCWNPNHNKLHKREILVPQIVTNSLPEIFIDSELWCGRGLFNYAFMFIASSAPTIELDAIRMICFDLPGFEFQTHFFEDRYNTLLANVDHNHPLCVVAPRALCMGRNHLTATTKAIIQNGGEGVILRLVNSLYLHGKTSQLIKFKAAYGDKEGLIVGVSDAGIKLELPSGQSFVVPRHNVHVVPFPSNGDIVSFSFKIDSRKELPVDAEIIRVRRDVSWEDVISSHSSDINDCSLTREFKTHSWGHWTTENMKSYMESLAKRFKLDPLIPDTWYKMPLKPLLQLKNVRTIVGKFGGYYKALSSLFPNIGLEQFAMPRTTWGQVVNRRKFFEDYAESNKFDPLEASEWYKQHISKVMSCKGASTVISYHNNSIPNALMDLFPEIGMQVAIWKQLENRTKFLIEYAEAHEFDPESAECWHSHAKNIAQDKSAQYILAYYGHSLFKALREAFPEMIQQKRHRRQFFEDFAAENQFDHLSADCWLANLSALKNQKHLSAVLAFHNNSIHKALRDLFIEIDWGKSKRFQKIFWSNPLNRRKFFETFAKEHNFDPLVAANWHLYSKEILLAKNAYSVLLHYGGSVNMALKDLFTEIEWNRPHTGKQGTFHDVAYRRKFFEEFATSNHFDPLVPANWIPWIDKVPHLKVAKSILSYYGGSVNKALKELFSEVQWGKSHQFYNKFFKHTMNRRSFFEDFAREKGFDPLQPEGWYPHMLNLKYTKNINSILAHHGKVSTALIDLFPDVNWRLSSLVKKALWDDSKKRRVFFENYARKRNFDPLQLQNWSPHVHTISSVRNAANVLRYHKGSVVKALRDLFPELHKQKKHT